MSLKIIRLRGERAWVFSSDNSDNYGQRRSDEYERRWVLNNEYDQTSSVEYEKKWVLMVRMVGEGSDGYRRERWIFNGGGEYNRKKSDRHKNHNNRYK